MAENEAPSALLSEEQLDELRRCHAESGLFSSDINALFAHVREIQGQLAKARQDLIDDHRILSGAVREAERNRDAAVALVGSLREQVQQLQRTLETRAERELEMLAEAEREASDRIERLEQAVKKVVKGIDDWNQSVQEIIGRVPDYHWGDLEELRTVLNEGQEVKP